MTLKRAHLIIEGRVQGVFFRQSMKKIAVLNGISGWVRNQDSGEVEAIVEGDAGAVDRTIDWCRTGPERAHVKAVDVEWQEPINEYAKFVVKG